MANDGMRSSQVEFCPTINHDSGVSLVDARHGLASNTNNRNNSFGGNLFSLGFRVVCPAIAW